MSRSARSARQRARTHPPAAVPDAPPAWKHPYTFQCTCCEVVEHRPRPVLPEGWKTEEVGADIYAYCPACAIDLPRGGIQ